MSEIDIRLGDAAKAKYIRFADEDGVYYTATRLRKGSDHEPSAVSIEEDDDTDSEVTIRNKEHGENLIKALQKAIELGWLK